MNTVLLLTIGCLILVWQLVNALSTYRKKYQQLLLIQDKNYELINLYKSLGQSIMALNIQLQAAQKLWQIQPTEAQQFLTDAYQLSSELMQELRQIVRDMDAVNTVSCVEQSKIQPTHKVGLPCAKAAPTFLNPTYEKSNVLPTLTFLASEKTQIAHSKPPRPFALKNKIQHLASETSKCI